ncbi:MAG: YebC/PmpR family DNA-binding transcriptional regulator [Deltaproteobacteria bacterium]|jgi:YebC/PmpR family DNA-binding regulatory protein|nr:YebC/PmpR family DNA-binding transcriptional regulator [Deltaproteobacteria bacterium]MBT4089129.1 YebC/PmpR family DNA-binding transcriptional regulator [Deltaproteobacteria bacterium]MBT4263920.1 YebC/PmpR family DNA-binding transcriptional regulator [Deltaproteobacteria bacterium]MBT4639863.1 YebC/PmpR family DNA-binding transcriptional regulator [Deltaproteobacteria bacterium]MBT6503452.1 YebC/PmpR family DNA-binding transcriptional regulator [Deltaproteobacteria bacterium]
MSGHSKWSTIKHKKGAADAKRSKVFTKVIREITVAAKMGGEDANSNPRLRSAIVLAKSVNMPNDTMNKAIKKGVGGDKSQNWENLNYEGYGPHNVAVIVECLTDNKNRTISSVRSIFSKNNGNIGSTNSVMYMFDRKGIIEIAKDVIDEETLTEYIIDAGADDIDSSDEQKYTIETTAGELGAVHRYLEEKEVKMDSSGLDLIPQNRVEIDDVTKAAQVIKFIEALEDDDDVQNVYSNFDITESVLLQLDN